jgi:hydrogenase maturation protein HypF
VTDDSFRRVAHLRTFRLPGGDMAVKEPRRTALGLLHELYGDSVFNMRELAPVQAFSSEELSLLKDMLAKGINSPVTSSAGRLFDAAASITGLRQLIRFEGQAAMELEFALNGIETGEHYPIGLMESGEGGAPAVVDWQAMIEEILNDVRRGAKVELISAKFHNALVESIVEVAARISEERIVLSGGCFQNSYLTECAVIRLQEAGFRPYWHQRIPPNDGGIALGQVIAASREMAKE